MLCDQDTIAAISTPPGKGGVGVVRVSGPKVPDLFLPLLKKKKLQSRFVYFLTLFLEEGPLDEAIVLYFENPNSFTGESVLELQTHGSPIILDALLERLVQLGVRLAEPGEFTKRAFLNEKIDLVQAEAVADLIEATSRQSAQMAFRSLKGVFSEKVSELSKSVVNLRVYVEAAIDFPDEEVDFLSDGIILSRLDSLYSLIDITLKKAEQGSALREGVRLVIAGAPNAGKSSLLNVLSGYEAAIVTPIAGTTRDIVKETISLKGHPVLLMDTAGVRNTEDVVEKIGVAKTQEAILGADIVLWVVDESAQSITEAKESWAQYLKELNGNSPLKVIFCFNKSDETQLVEGAFDALGDLAVRISAKKGCGIEDLTRVLSEALEAGDNTEGLFTARRRHVEALKKALFHLKSAKTQLIDFKAGELVAEELNLAHEAIGSIVGFMSQDDLLGEIFSNFCIGK